MADSWIWNPADQKCHVIILKRFSICYTLRLKMNIELFVQKNAVYLLSLHQRSLFFQDYELSSLNPNLSTICHTRKPFLIEEMAVSSNTLSGSAYTVQSHRKQHLLKAIMADFTHNSATEAECWVHFKNSPKELFQSLFLYCGTQEIIKNKQQQWKPKHHNHKRHI